MSNKTKDIIVIVVALLAIVAMVVSLAATTVIVDANRIEVGDIEVGDEVYIVNESINNQAWIINGTVIEVKYQDNVIVEYSVLLPRDSVVIYRRPENVFLTYKQALKYVLNN